VQRNLIAADWYRPHTSLARFIIHLKNMSVFVINQLFSIKVKVKVKVKLSL
jgi:hypothetical protein